MYDLMDARNLILCRRSVLIAPSSYFIVLVLLRLSVIELTRPSTLL